MRLDEAVLKQFVAEELENDMNMFSDIYLMLEGTFQQFFVAASKADINNSELGGLAHNLKSHTKMLGAKDLSQGFFEIEKYCKNQIALDSATLGKKLAATCEASKFFLKALSDFKQKAA